MLIIAVLLYIFAIFILNGTLLVYLACLRNVPNMLNSKLTNCAGIALNWLKLLAVQVLFIMFFN